MKISAQAAMVRLDLATVIEKMNRYSSMRLKNIDTKQLEGKTSEDFSSDVLLKVLDGTRDWLNADTDNMEAFLMMCLNSEISNFLKKIGRRDVGIFTINDIDTEYNDGIKYANPSVFNAEYTHDQNR